MSLTPEVLKQIRKLELSTRKLVNNLFAGQYHAAFKGQGMTFSDFREYVAGDDVRSISWPLTARTGKTFVKKYEEERELTLMLVIDVSGSTRFGSTTFQKKEVINQLAAILAFSAARNNDYVGLIMFTNSVEHVLPPRRGRSHCMRLLRDLFVFEPLGRQTHMTVALEYIMGILKKRAIVFVLSDFMDTNYERPLRLLSRKHDVVSVVVEDGFELNFPKVGLLNLGDLETGHQQLVDTSSKKFQKAFRESAEARRQGRDLILKRAQVDRIDVFTQDDIVAPLIEFFRKRRRR